MPDIGFTPEWTGGLMVILSMFVIGAVAYIMGQMNTK